MNNQSIPDPTVWATNPDYPGYLVIPWPQSIDGPRSVSVIDLARPWGDPLQVHEDLLEGNVLAKNPQFQAGKAFFEANPAEPAPEPRLRSTPDYQYALADKIRAVIDDDETDYIDEFDLCTAAVRACEPIIQGYAIREYASELKPRADRDEALSRRMEAGL